MSDAPATPPLSPPPPAKPAARTEMIDVGAKIFLIVGMLFALGFAILAIIVFVVLFPR